jgi:integrase
MGETMITIEEGIYQEPSGYYVVRATRGSKPPLKKQERYPPGTELLIMRAWRRRALTELEERLARGRANPGTFAAGIPTYFTRADITKACAKQRTPQLAWWSAQYAAEGAEVFSPAAVKAELAAIAAGTRKPRTGTLAELPIDALEPARLREILKVAFEPTDRTVDPTEFASTSNSYRTALYHFFTVTNRDDKYAVNPLDNVDGRPTAGAQASGQDARIIREILKHVPSTFGKDAEASEARLEVLAWVHITSKQLKALEPADWHDIPNATPEDILAGAITITIRPRLKGRLKRIPPPETIPLNPWGVAAMRRFAKADAWTKPDKPKGFSNSSLNKIFQRGCVRAQAALAAKGVAVDLSAMTVYHLKHSLATTASLASGGLIDRQGKIVTSPGVQKALGHAKAKTTTIYTQAGVDPIVRHVNLCTSNYLEQLFTVPLTSQPAALRLVK